MMCTSEIVSATNRERVISPSGSLIRTKSASRKRGNSVEPRSMYLNRPSEYAMYRVFTRAFLLTNS